MKSSPLAKTSTNLKDTPIVSEKVIELDEEEEQVDIGPAGTGSVVDMEVFGQLLEIVCHSSLFYCSRNSIRFELLLIMISFFLQSIYSFFSTYLFI